MKLGNVAAASGKGIFAGVAGTAAMTLPDTSATSSRLTRHLGSRAGILRTSALGGPQIIAARHWKLFGFSARVAVRLRDAKPKPAVALTLGRGAGRCP